MKLKEIQALYLALHLLSDGDINFKLVISDGTFTFSSEILTFSRGSQLPKVEYMTNDFDYTYTSLRPDDVNLLPIKVAQELKEHIRFRGIGPQKAFDHPELLLRKLIKFIREIDNPDLSEIDTLNVANVELLSGKQLDYLLLDKDADYRVISLVVE